MKQLSHSFFNGNVGFAVGTGRCGTKFMATVASHEPHVASHHERHPLNDTFYRYSKWYGLPVDPAGFLHIKEQGIRADLADHSFSFESSAYLSTSIQELYEAFGAKFILMVRSPERVVNSFHNKGWYMEPFVRTHTDLAPSYQESESFHHFLARFAPSGDKFSDWNAMTRVGKLAWYWSAMNERVLEQFDGIPETHWRVEKLENLNYQRYCDLATFLGFDVTLDEESYSAIANRRPNAVGGAPTIASWTDQEIGEFEAEVGETASRLGYEYRVERLPVPKPRPVVQIPPPKKGLIDKLRSSLAR